MVAALVKRLTQGVIPAITLLVVLLLSLSLMSEATENSVQFSQLYSALLLVSGIGLVILIVLIGANLFRLVSQYQRGVAGSRLTARMVVMFVLLSLLPVSVVYYFSLQFLHRSIDSWFDVRIEQALDDALELSRTALDIRVSELLKQSEQMSKELVDIPDGLATLTLNELRDRSGANEVTLTTPSGVIIATSGIDQSTLIPNRPSEEILLQLRQGYPYAGLDPIRNRGLHVRIVTNIAASGQITDQRVLQLLFAIPERLGTLANSVQAAFSLYRELAYLRQPLKYSFTLILSLVLLLSVLSAVWAAFFSARRLVAPIRHLAEGTKAVAGGDYSKRLPSPTSDELGTLVRSFNDMTRRIEQSRDETRRSQHLVESQRAYLETVLRHLSSGVLTVEAELNLRTANRAAEEILGLEIATLQGENLQQIGMRLPNTKPFFDALEKHLIADLPEWSEEIVLFGSEGRKVLMCQGSRLPATDSEEQNYVVVFDDISTLIQAQRDAAWGEVARRLAHEIKNPLTPIQLSAERLRHKYLKTADKKSDLLDRYTHTIIKQVELMKGMVNAFAEYAHAPPLQREAVDLNKIVGEVLDLYRSSNEEVVLKQQFDSGHAIIYADTGRVRQILHNLLKNSLEAMQKVSRPEITFATTHLHSLHQSQIELVVRDNGSGFDPVILAESFEPYVTTKERGTGLGLAIVKKMVEEHHGSIQARNEPAGGAAVVVRFPVEAIDSKGLSATGTDSAETS